MSDVRKVVVNRCYGGFSLSDEGITLYASLKGLTLYPENDRHGFTTWWTVPEGDRPQEIVDWMSASMDERRAYNKALGDAQLYDRELDRDDPFLVEVVDTLGDRANGCHTKLEVVKIPADVKWGIQEYDGREWIAEEHRTW